MRKLNRQQRGEATAILNLAGVDEGILTDAIYDLIYDRDRYFRLYVDSAAELEKRGKLAAVRGEGEPHGD